MAGIIVVNYTDKICKQNKDINSMLFKLIYKIPKKEALNYKKAGSPTLVKEINYFKEVVKKVGPPTLDIKIKNVKKK
jgi:hypothetical protein